MLDYLINEFSNSVTIFCNTAKQHLKKFGYFN